MPNTALNRTTQTLMTNKSGGSVAYGGVVIVDTTTDSSFTTTTTSGISTAQVGVVLEPNGIANNALGMVAVGGWCPKVTLNTAATRGQFIKTHTVAGQGTPHSSPQVEGDFAVALEASTTPACNLFGSPNGPLTGGSGTVTHTAGNLTANAVVLGNAAADITVLGSLGTTTTVLHGNAAGAPTFGAVSLTADVSGVLPGANGGSLVYLTTLTASSSATLDFTTISSNYDTYFFDVVALVPATSTAHMYLRFGTGAGPTWDAGANYTYANAGFTQLGTGQNWGAAAQNQVFLANSLGTGATGGYSASMWVKNINSASAYKIVVGESTAVDSSSNFVGSTINVLYVNTTAATGVRWLFSTGNVASGIIRCYGLAKS